MEDLDKIIEQSDPTALQNIEDVRKIAAEIGQPLEILEPDDLLDPDANHKNGFKDKLKLKSILLWVWFKALVFESIAKSIDWAGVKKKQFAEAKQKYRHWPTKSKLLLQGAIVLFVGTIVFSYFAFVKKTLVYKQELFMTSFEIMADHTWDLSKEEGLGSSETFYNSSRIPKNIFKLKKVVVNIQPSERSGPNPMVAFEFSLDGSSSEALLEIKDREGEILDQVQRTIEDYSFDEINDIDGKKMITDKVKITINRLLTLGKIRNVYIQGYIIKP